MIDPAIFPTLEPTGWATSFATAARSQPWLAAYSEMTDADHPRDWTAIPIEGTLPEGLTGILRRILAGRHETFGLRYHHWWDGDGAIAEFRIGNGRLDYRTRYIETTKLKHERAAGRPVYQQFGTAVPGLIRPDNLDDMNPANVAILDHGGELLALGDWCSAWRIDRDTLDSAGRKEWSTQTAGAPFSAHPKVDRHGHLWSIGYEPWKGRLHLYHIGPDGTLLKSAALALPSFGLVHDFIITETHLVIPLTSTRWSREREQAGHAMLDCLEWAPDAPIRVLVVDKNSFEVSATHDMPPGMIYHCGNGYALANGDIRFHCCYFADAHYMHGTFRHVMQGSLAMGAPPMQMLVTLPAAGGAARVEMQALIGELPRVDERYNGQFFRQLWLGTPGEMRGPPDKFGFSALTRLNLETGAEDSYFFGHHIIAEEPAFAPRPGSTAEADGWMVGTFRDIESGRTSLAVFDAMHIADGPICVAHLPCALPIGVHGNFHAR